ncbi:DNA-binding protein, partial [Massilia alkalitolerans]|uniref:DNA-binding protein n=1 Tax=Massilia alkalitolerans TaxID=286638 RepID=UPI0028A69A39
FEQVAAAAEELQAGGLTPTAKLVRPMLGSTGSLATLQRHIVEWRSRQGSVQPAIRILAPEIQRVIFKFIDEDVARANTELTQLVEQTRRDADDLAADNEEQTDLVRQLKAELADQATRGAQQEGQIARLLEELGSARDEAAVERREAEQARLELGKLQLRLDTCGSLENELRQLRAGFEAQRQACVHAEQNVAVLKAQREILEARLVELKEAASPTPTRGKRNADSQARAETEQRLPTVSRRSRNGNTTGKSSAQDPPGASAAVTDAPVEPGDSRQARLC